MSETQELAPAVGSDTRTGDPDGWHRVRPGLWVGRTSRRLYVGRDPFHSDGYVLLPPPTSATEGTGR